MQQNTEKTIQGQLFGTLKLFAGISIPIGMLISAIFINETKQYIDLIFITCSILSVIMFFYFKFINKEYSLFYSIKEYT